MRSKQESGFKKIKIADSNMDYYDQQDESGYWKKYRLCLILSAIIIFIIIIVIVILIIGNINYKKRIYGIRRSNQNKTNIDFQNNSQTQSDFIIKGDDNNKKNEEIELKEKKENYNLEPIFNSIEKIVQKPNLTLNENIKISIIIMNNAKDINNGLEKLYQSINLQKYPDKEIFLVNLNLEENKTPSDTIEKLKQESTIVEYGIKIGKLMQRYDVVNMTKGEYFLFIEGDDTFSGNGTLQFIYEKAINDKLDILEFKTYHNLLQKDKIFTQPELFSSIYYGKDNFNNLNQFHLNGKLIRRQFFLNIFKEIKIAPFYFEQNIQKFDQSMLLLLLFQKAETFEIVDIRGTTKQCTSCERDMNIPEIKNALDLLIYMRFLIEYSPNNVPEKRRAADIFIHHFLERNLNIDDEVMLNILNDTLDLYLNCDKIGEEDIKAIERYKGGVVDKLKNLQTPNKII